MLGTLYFFLDCKQGSSFRFGFGIFAFVKERGFQITASRLGVEVLRAQNTFL
jgi:hypothetical protein